MIQLASVALALRPFAEFVLSAMIIGFPVLFLFSYLLARFVILRPLFVCADPKLPWQFRIADYYYLVAVLIWAPLLSFSDQIRSWNSFLYVLWIVELSAAAIFMWWSITGASSRAKINSQRARFILVVLVGPTAFFFPIAIPILLMQHEVPLLSMLCAFYFACHFIALFVVRRYRVA
jgi:hypothetical protein